MPSLFFSYSHVDELLRDQLETHLSALQRQGVLTSWHDRPVTAGTELNNAIDSHLAAADIVLLLVSPDFIASEYCYEREMTRALERHEAGEARVIPVILRPSDWLDLPFGKLLAAPKDGKPITMWPNIDAAFLDVVLAIKHAFKELGQSSKPKSVTKVKPAAVANSSDSESSIRSSNLRVKKQFTTWIKIAFAMTASNTSPNTSRTRSVSSLLAMKA